MQILLDCSWFWAVACLLLGAACACILYVFNKNTHLSKRTRIFLFAARCISVASIAFLLFSPMLKFLSRNEEKPVIVIVQDNSKSLVLTGDSVFYRTDYVRKIADLQKDLSRNYEVRTYSFGGSFEEGFDGKFNRNSTDISLVMKEIEKRYRGRNVGAVILASDGICNSGEVPTNLLWKANYPIFTIALGDTSIRRDAIIANVSHPKITYLEDKFPLEITIRADKLSGKSGRLSVEKDGRTLHSKDIRYSSDCFSQTETFLVTAETVGTQQYTVKITPSSGEVSVKNNVRKITVDVIDGRRKVAVVAQSPNPDMGLLKRCFEDSKTYDLDFFVTDEFSGPVEKYNLFVFHQLPSKNPKHNALVTSVLKKQVPAFFILGSQTDFPQFNALQLGLAINRGSEQTDEATPVLNGSFTNFSFSGGFAQKTEQFPPIAVPFGEYRISPSVQTLLSAKIGRTMTGNPILCFSQKQGIRYGIFVGDGFWKWGMADYSQNASHETVSELLDRIVVYLSAEKNTEHFRISGKNAFSGNEVVAFEAELYDDNYAQTNTPDVLFSLKNESGEVSEFKFGRQGGGYRLSLGNLPEGKYVYEVETSLAGKKYAKSGSFVVEESVLEEMTLTANHLLLNTMAEETGGEMVPLQEMGVLPDLISQHSDIKNVIYEDTRYSELLNLPWVLVFTVLLLSVEWVARKYCGEI